MIDIKLIRDDPEVVYRAMEKRGEGRGPVEEIIEIDSSYRQALKESETLRARRNDVSKQISLMKDKPAGLIAEMRQVGDRITQIEAESGLLSARLEDRLLRLPNLPSDDVPPGRGSEGNIEVRSWGRPREFTFTPLPHWDLAEKLGIIDFQRGVKLSGTRFYVLRGMGSLLQRSLINFMLDLHVGEHGYTEMYPPSMVKRECLVGSSNLPKFADNLYHDAEEDYWFVPTAEVPLTNLHRDEILAPGTLPLYYAAHTSCFRREKMAAGKDTRGIKRGHQFEKVEMYKFVDPATSDAELNGLLDNAEDICRRLELPHRVIQLCTGDLGFAAVKTFDIEMWAAGCGEWLEVSSCSNCGDFQARRANIRYRPDPEARPRLVHTLNGSGLALPRVMIAVMENYQQEDGSISVPTALRPYMNTDTIR
ncbi:MAG: serine--tRNA ligase [Chloroflexi bacterium]|jgi:seryl-tRNA synthetase|nr:serine--tRNA ligase [Chloroflexota bacterium]